MEDVNSSNPFTLQEPTETSPKSSENDAKTKKAEKNNDCTDAESPDAPKILKRRPTVKSIKKKLLKKGVTMPLIPLQKSPSQSSFPNSPSSGGVEMKLHT